MDYGEIAAEVQEATTDLDIGILVHGYFLGYECRAKKSDGSLYNVVSVAVGSDAYRVYCPPQDNYENVKQFSEIWLKVRPVVGDNGLILTGGKLLRVG